VCGVFDFRIGKSFIAISTVVDLDFPSFSSSGTVLNNVRFITGGTISGIFVCFHFFIVDKKWFDYKVI